MNRAVVLASMTVFGALILQCGSSDDAKPPAGQGGTSGQGGTAGTGAAAGQAGTGGSAGQAGTGGGAGQGGTAGGGSGGTAGDNCPAFTGSCDIPQDDDGQPSCVGYYGYPSVVEDQCAAKPGTWSTSPCGGSYCGSCRMSLGAGTSCLEMFYVTGSTYCADEGALENNCVSGGAVWTDQ